MTTFADSSALVKLYADEDGAASIRELTVLVIAQVTRVEVPAAIWRKQRRRELSTEQAGVLVAWFEADYFGDLERPPRFARIALTAELLDEAAHLCALHGIRAYDAVQLASALAARSVPECTWLASFDRTLRDASVAEGFALIPPAL